MAGRKENKELRKIIRAMRRKGETYENIAKTLDISAPLAYYYGSARLDKDREKRRSSKTVDN